MTPHAFYKGPPSGLWTHLGEQRTRCAYPPCGKPFTTDGEEFYCSAICAEDDDTVQKGGTSLPEHERCTCGYSPDRVRAYGHHIDCPRYVPHPEDYSHPLENE